MNHEQILEALPAFALGALEVDEMVTVASYVRQQADFLGQLRVAQDAAHLLAHAAPDARIESALKQRLRQRVQADGKATFPTPPTSLTAFDPTLDPKAPLLPARWVAQELSPYLLSGVTDAVEPAVELPPTTGLRGNRWLWGALALAACCAALVIIFDGIQTRLALQESQLNLETTLTQMHAQAGESALLRTTNQQLEVTNNSLARKEADLANFLQTAQQQLVLVSTANRVFTLLGTAIAPTLHGSLYLKGDQGVLVLYGLRPPSTGQTYQLWLVVAGNRQTPANLLSADLFTKAGDQEPKWLNLTLPSNAPEFLGVNISLEPVGGSSAPSTPILLESRNG
jgi:hypothetical protein